MPTQSADIGLVVFDLGKVLVNFDYAIAARNLGPFAQLSPDQILDLLLRTPLLLDYERGALTTDEFYAALVQHAGLQTTFTNFATRFGDIFSPIEPMINLLDHLQAAGRATAVLSNTNELAIQHIHTHFPFFDRFNHHVLSFEHRAMKPDPALYRALEKIAGVPPGHILFLDDRPENVESAQNLGWQAFVHDDPENTRAHFARLGLIRI
jgi:FMN phosphatase YigB (HAD superfamily)